MLLPDPIVENTRFISNPNVTWDQIEKLEMKSGSGKGASIPSRRTEPYPGATELLISDGHF